MSPKLAKTNGRSADPRAAQTAKNELAVSGYIDADGNAVVSDVRPASGPGPLGDPAPYGLVASDGSGMPSSTVPLTTQERHIDYDGAPAFQQVFDVRVPATTRTVDLVDAAGTTVASRSASVTTPEVTLLTQTRPTKIGLTGTTTVRAKITDPDPAPVPLTVDLSITSDEGATLRTVRSTSSPAGVVTFKVPNRELPRTKRARFVVRAHDGWNAGQGQSGFVSIAGFGPRVSISGPRRNAKINSNENVELEGTAFDDAGMTLPAKALRWFDGRKRIGTGYAVSLMGMTAGKHVLRLEARDARGRRGVAELPLRVRASAPQVIELVAPATLARKARRLPVRVATVLPSVLKIGKRSFKVGPKPRTLEIPVKPGSRSLVLRGELVGPAGQQRVTLRVAR